MDGPPMTKRRRPTHETLPQTQTIPATYPLDSTAGLHASQKAPFLSRLENNGSSLPQNTTISNWDERTNISDLANPGDNLSSSHMDHDLAIDGRSSFEETNWWDPNVRETHCRPGSGVLGPVLAEELHKPHHSLFCVDVTALPIVRGVQDETYPGPSIKSSTLSHPQHTSNVPSPPPSEYEVKRSVPHPNAYYCPKDNGWVIVSWASSSVAPFLAQSFIKKQNYALLDQIRRRRTALCTTTNETHHFHKYDKAVDGHNLTPPFRKDIWQTRETVQHKRRVSVIMNKELNANEANAEDAEPLIENRTGTAVEEEELLDLHVCCQCSFYCVISRVVPGVIHLKHIKELVRERKGQPTLGRTGEQAIALAFETLLTAIKNKLWEGNNRRLRVMSGGFQSKLGWNPNIKHIFELLGFEEEIVDRDITLKPPMTDLVTQAGKQNRRKLLRAWLEISAWLTDFKRRNASYFKDVEEYKLYVQLDNAREWHLAAIDAHPERIPRGGLPDGMLDVVRPMEGVLRGFGLTPTTFSGDLMVFAYLAQCRCDPAGTPKYFTSLVTIATQLEEHGYCPVQLQALLMMEQSRKRFTLEDITTSAVILGFGAKNVLGIEYDHEVPEEFVEKAWKDCVERYRRNFKDGSEMHRLSNEAFRILAEARGSVRLWKAWEVSANIHINPDSGNGTTPSIVPRHFGEFEWQFPVENPKLLSENSDNRGQKQTAVSLSIGEPTLTLAPPQLQSGGFARQLGLEQAQLIGAKKSSSNTLSILKQLLEDEQVAVSSSKDEPATKPGPPQHREFLWQLALQQEAESWTGTASTKKVTSKALSLPEQLQEEEITAVLSRHLSGEQALLVALEHQFQDGSDGTGSSSHLETDLQNDIWEYPLLEHLQGSLFDHLQDSGEYAQLIALQEYPLLEQPNDQLIHCFQDSEEYAGPIASQGQFQSRSDDAGASSLFRSEIDNKLAVEIQRKIFSDGGFDVEYDDDVVMEDIQSPYSEGHLDANHQQIPGTSRGSEGMESLAYPTQSSSRQFGCGVCGEMHDATETLSLAECGHNFCKGCLARFTKTKIRESWHLIPCPECLAQRRSSRLPQDIIDKLNLRHRDLQRLDELQLAVHSIGIQCPGCKESINVDREEYAEQSTIICPLPRCRLQWCKACLKIFSTPEAAGKHKCKGTFDDLMRKRGWKYCPGCRTPVERTSGCSHMTCVAPGCNTHFCYKCGGLIIDTTRGGDVGAAVTEHTCPPSLRKSSSCTIQ